MERSDQNHRRRFTLEEIVIVMGILGLLVVLAAPMRSQGERIIDDAQQVDATID